MADYWKSQAKKFCDFCKCWIADNKPSVEFHEKGKRHKENVEKRLKEIGQKSRKEYKETLKVDSEMKKMEEAAMRAYLKDIEGDGDGDYTSHQIKRELKEKEDQQRKEALAEVKVERPAQVESSVEEEAGSSTAVEEERKTQWLEAESDDGHTYYWHSETGEAVWEVPPEGFVSIPDQADRRDSEKTAAEDAELREEKLKAIRRAEDDKAREAEESARRAREKMRSRAVKKEKREIIPFEPVVMGPAPKPDPYGGWTTVQRFDPEPLDLQLPRQDYAEISVPVIVEKEKKFKFREKVMGSLDGEGSTDFKKRKFNSGSKKNMRQRLDDQE